MSWAIGGIAFLVLILSIMGFVAAHDHGIKAAQQTADQAAISAAQGNTAICKQANADLQTSLDAIETDRIKQNNNVLAWKALANRAADVAQANLNANQSTLAQLGAAKLDARAKAARLAQVMTCEQTLAEIDADSKAFAAQRAILFPTMAPAVDAVRIK